MELTTTSYLEKRVALFCFGVSLRYIVRTTNPLLSLPHASNMELFTDIHIYAHTHIASWTYTRKQTFAYTYHAIKLTDTYYIMHVQYM